MSSFEMILAYYKSTPFFVRKEQIVNYGQKRINHNYPQSSNRYSEAQGVNPDEITLDIFFYGTGYVDKFELFKNVCSVSDSGLLILPILGIYENMVAELASAELAHTNIGEITTTVTFKKTVVKPSPTSAVASSQTVAGAGASAAGAVGGAF